MGPKSIVGLAGALIVVLLVLSSVFIIPETHRGVKLRFGELVQTDIQAGIHFKVPVIDQVREFDIRILTMDLPTRQYLTVEKKPLDVDSYVAWKIRDVDQFYRATGGDELRAQSLLLSRVDNGLRNQFGVRTMVEVVSGERDELMRNLIDLVNQTSVSEFGIEVRDIRVKGIEFPGQVSENVFRRMATERMKLAQEFRSRGRELAEGIRADADRQRTVVLAEAFSRSETTRGEGDGQAARTYADAYGENPDFYSFYRSLEAYRNTFANKDDLMVIDANSAFLKFLKDPQGAN
ncbi:protease modulator HflC [Marinobacter sp. M3C]|jgi:membrane protease subunit HflC|uniref:protease modulator HflC n=1 Tax=unclassified Marinobacter TaxID=83889 RepID=UPI00200EBD1A|nr:MULTISPECIES: protease modulator HflC [unclassified Marinobacter]MCL1477537.1 protease modulator HflC [Marinobacter sp.]MCL1481642.1 protease modulator HflC [Marinobacter sp.]MCL1483349.1 protease modulator HflC [Marinobacter sp.]MCL1487049.1 protease modulator HflC [Marinobacter sp.]UQG54726.1 protease modulator HflC [Marinobacter sp. M4C]